MRPRSRRTTSSQQGRGSVDPWAIFGVSPDVLGLIERLGWPVTKASYVSAIFFPQDPEFPLDAEILARVPRELPGRMPRSLRDVDLGVPEPSGERQLPEPLIELVMRRYGFTRKHAIEEILRFGG